MARAQLTAAFALFCLLAQALAARELHGGCSSRASWRGWRRRAWVAPPLPPLVRAATRASAKQHILLWATSRELLTVTWHGLCQNPPVTEAGDMTGMDHGGMMMGVNATNSGGMQMGGAGSQNMSDPCYSKPSDAACAEFQRSDEGGRRACGGQGGGARRGRNAGRRCPPSCCAACLMRADLC